MRTLTGASRTTVACVGLALAVGSFAQAIGPPPANAQQALADATATPEGAADLFLRSVRLIRWNTAARLMHPETLERFHQTVTMIADADTSGAVREYFTQTDSAAYADLDPAVVFDRAVGRMVDDMPGLMHAIYDRDDEVIGRVIEESGEAHAVYRTTARISGAVSEVKVMQLARVQEGWRVFWSDELEVLETALRGVARNRRSPGG